MESEDVSNYTIVSRDIKMELSKIKSSLDKAKMPENKEEERMFREAIENSMNAWNECHELLNTGRAKISYRNKTYIAEYQDSVNKANYHFFLESEKGEFRQCEKRTLPIEAGSDKYSKLIYLLLFDSDHNLKLYQTYNDDMVEFYPSGSIKSVVYNTSSGNVFAIEWSVNGDIIVQGSYNKSKRYPLLLEAEEKARQMLQKSWELAENEMNNTRKE